MNIFCNISKISITFQLKEVYQRKIQCQNIKISAIHQNIHSQWPLLFSCLLSTCQMISLGLDINTIHQHHSSKTVPPVPYYYHHSTTPELLAGDQILVMEFVPGPHFLVPRFVPRPHFLLPRFVPSLHCLVPSFVPSSTITRNF